MTGTASDSVDAVKAYLRIDKKTTADNALIGTLADAATAALLKALQRNLLNASYVETRDGTGTKALMLLNFPVTAVASVVLRDPMQQQNLTPPSVTLVQGVDYAFTRYAVKRYAGVWPRGVQNVVVSYTAGYVALPDDLTHAATKLAAVRYRELERIGQKSKVIGSESITFDLSEMPPDVEAIIDRYRVGMNLFDELTGTLP